MRVSERYRHPFEAKGKLKLNYREDESIFENCGNWENKSHRDINLVRVLFSSNKNDLARIVALRFFTKPNSFEDKTLVLPKKIPVPAKIS